MKILLISSCEIEQDIFRLALERLNSGAEFFETKDCKTALASLQSNVIPTPDFIILDTDIPDSDANSWLRILKASPTVGLSKIILYSSSKETSEIQMMMRQGAQSHIFKSYSFTVFCHDLSNMIAETY